MDTVAAVLNEATTHIQSLQDHACADLAILLNSSAAVNRLSPEILSTIFQVLAGSLPVARSVAERPMTVSGQEFHFYDIPVHAEHLALLGDIGWTVKDKMFN